MVNKLLIRPYFLGGGGTTNNHRENGGKTLGMGAPKNNQPHLYTLYSRYRCEKKTHTRNVRRKHGYFLLAIHRIGKFTHCIWLMFMIYVGKYDSIMDPLGNGLCEELSSDQTLQKRGFIGLPSYISGLFHKPWNQNPFIFTNQDDSSCQGSMF